MIYLLTYLIGFAVTFFGACYLEGRTTENPDVGGLLGPCFFWPVFLPFTILWLLGEEMAKFGAKK